MRLVVVLGVLLACKPARVVAPVAGARGVTAPAESRDAVVPVDRDGEGTFEIADRCPSLPEDHDGFEDEDGCVDRDNDRDRIVDAHEYVDGRWTNCDYAPTPAGIEDCRNEPENYNGYYGAWPASV